MSIITDALKKAEQEREQKTKRTVGKTETVVPAIEEAKPVDVLLEQSHVVEDHIEKRIHISKEIPSRFREVAIVSLIIGIVILSLSALFLLPSWPGRGSNLSIISHPFWNAGFFQVPKIYQQNTLPAKSRSFDGNVLDFPFSLSGISFQGENRYAIVNGVIVQKGDLIDGAHVKEILGREVVLDTRAGEIKLKLL